jgi:hypothetical protein
MLEEGHDDDVRAQLEHALAFYRSVGATRFIREVEALLAATDSAERHTEVQPRA